MSLETINKVRDRVWGQHPQNVYLQQPFCSSEAIALDYEQT